MPKTKQPIRCFDGEAEPYSRFWTWTPRNEADDGGPAELSFYGVISEYEWFEDDITPQKFKQDLETFGGGGPIVVSIHSSGGAMFAASAIRAMLMRYEGHVTTRIDGVCASAAVWIATSGDVVQIQDSASVMVHNPGYNFLIVSELEVFKNGLLDTYEKRTGLPRNQLSRMLNEGTWMTAKQAVENGFADEVISTRRVIDPDDYKKELSNFANVPPEILNMVDVSLVENGPEPEPAPEHDLEFERQVQALRDEVDIYLQRS
jgi:ATP-dependent Clp protease protease subunit